MPDTPLDNPQALQTQEPGDHPLTARRWDAPWKAAFLESMSRIPNVSAAARHVGISRNGAYLARRADEEFAAAWDEAREVGLDLLEQIVHRRATVGEPRTTTRTTTVIGPNGTTTTEMTSVETHIDNQLLLRLLSAHRPERWGDNVHHSHGGEGGGPVRVEVYRHPSRERLEELRVLYETMGHPVIEGTAVESRDE